MALGDGRDPVAQAEEVGEFVQHRSRSGRSHVGDQEGVCAGWPRPGDRRYQATVPPPCRRMASIARDTGRQQSACRPNRRCSTAGSARTILSSSRGTRDWRSGQGCSSPQALANCRAHVWPSQRTSRGNRRGGTSLQRQIGAMLHLGGKRRGGTVINADTMQTYDAFPILTAQPSVQGDEHYRALWCATSERVHPLGARWRPGVGRDVPRKSPSCAAVQTLRRALMQGISVIPALPRTAERGKCRMGIDGRRTFPRATGRAGR